MFKNLPQIRDALTARNNTLAQFWFSDSDKRMVSHRIFANKKILVIDAEDTFTAMLAQVLISVGLEVTVRPYHAPNLLEGVWDLIVPGPGPGDPRNNDLPRIRHLRKVITTLYSKKVPFFAVCLSHQLLSLILGFEIIQLKTPDQGIQREINFFGKYERVSFYNTFVAQNNEETLKKLDQLSIETCYDPITQNIHALRGFNFVSLQFHPESILTQHGVDIIANNIKRIMTNESDNSLVELEAISTNC